MKKVFAFLSVLALTIAVVGFAPKSSVAADDLWTEDPTLSENEIPMYIMDSIYTTFPNYYDNATKADSNWQGAARMYPWNETRLQVKQMNSEGEYTGYEYAIYFSGSTSASSSGTGNNLVFFAEQNGQVVLARMDGGKMKYNITAMDPSLSHMRTNITGHDISFDAIELFTAAGSTNGGNMYNRILVFDGNGRAVRGVAINQGYYAESNPDAINPIAAEYCYVDGVVTKAEAGVVCDKVKEAAVDDNGDPVIGDDGQVVMVETDEDDYLYSRFVWEWVSAETFESDSFVGVNTVPYLSTGWDAMKWDYATYEESSNGYICIAFLGSESSDVKLTDAQLAVYTETCEANGVAAPTSATRRQCAAIITVPEGGYIYDFGYLDKGRTALCEKFMDIFKSAYYYGRTVDAEGNGMAYQKTCDFSAKPLYFTDKTLNGVSYQLMEGQNTVEVLQGEKFTPASNIVYTGLSNYWSVANDLTSFKSDTSVLDLYIVQDGVTMVQPATGYTSFADMVADFVNDWNTFVDEQGLGDDRKLVIPDANWTDAEIVANFYNPLGWDLASTSAKADSFTGTAKYWNKWSWMFEYISTKAKANNVNTVNWDGTGAVASPGSSRDALYGFLTESAVRSISGTYANTCADFSGGKAREWLDERTNVEIWQQYTIDTANDPIDTNYVVTYKAVNSVTGISSEITIKYVVVDEYTPILKVNADNLIITPTNTGSSVEVPAIDKYTFCTAYNGKYNGSSILGDDISYKVHYSSDTLDFDNPTEGEHTVKAIVYSASGAKYTEKTFTVSIEDMTAPRAYGQDLILAYGSYFTASMGITFAYDSVDGNLMNNDFRGWITDVSRTVVRTDKPGKYTVSVEISDRSGNATTVTYSVTVLAATDLSSVEDGLDTLQGLVATKSALESFGEEVEELNSKVDALTAKVDALAASKKCGSKSAVLVELLASASLLALVLRKRH